MKYVYHPDSLVHNPPFFLVRGERRPMPETPERARMLVSVLEKRGHGVIRPNDYGPGPRAAVHSPEYLAFLEHGHARWMALPGAAEVMVPNVHRAQATPTYPTGIVGQAGYHMYDMSSGIVATTWTSVTATANTAVHAARLVAEGEEDAAYALCRPPGHHATRDMAGGFCYLNNVAIAAEAALPILRRQGRPARAAILDVDLHHGNGTQDIFYDRDDVLFVSIHADPNNFYPFMAGHAHERGEGRGLGFTLNLPLPIGSGETKVLTTIGRGLETVKTFAPDILLVSLGLDTYEGDPLAAFGMTTPGFARMGALIAGLGLPTVLVQEGGYAVQALADNLESFLNGFEAAHPAAVANGRTA